MNVINLQELPIGENYPEICNIVIEIPKGSRNKVEYREDTGTFALDRVLYSTVFYPTDYGFIPQTRDEDGDALDALLLTTTPLFTGCVVEGRAIGLMKMVDGGEVDDKILFVPTGDQHFKDIKTLDDVDEHTLKEIAHFFKTYKLLQNKEVEIEGWHSKEEALKIIEKCFKMESERLAAK